MTHKNNVQHQRAYREKAKELGLRKLSIFISPLAYQAITDKAAEASMTKAELIEKTFLNQDVKE